jgi:hypothetical protein
VGNLATRIRRLEGAGGGRECPRCSGTTITSVNGGVRSVTKHGRRFTPEEAEAFVADEEDGRCPVCGARRTPIRIGWEPPRRS